MATRDELCELLWDAPADPRGELRGCVSKIRRLVDTPDHKRLLSDTGGLCLDLADCDVDAFAILRAVGAGVALLPAERERELLGLFGGDFLEGLEVARSPTFDLWLIAQRRRFRACHTALLEHFVPRAPESERLHYLELWRELAPFDMRVHQVLFATFALAAKIREGEEHLKATSELFEAEGLDAAPLRAAWRAARVSMPVRRASAAVTAESTVAPSRAAPPDAARRASIAVAPFVDVSPVAGTHGGLAGALAHDVITRLAKMRSLFVIAQGSVFALHERGIGPGEAGRMLDVDYVTAGTVRRDGERLDVGIELSETRTARVVWAETFNESADDAFLVLDEIGNRIVAAIANEIETLERNRALLRPPSSLDAWEAHHRGLWHMYRFTLADNREAARFFARAVALDPTFSRAYAGLSFTHFQNAFQGWAPRDQAVRCALDAATRSLTVDDRDPAAHSAMGRASWLCGNHSEAVSELRHAIELSPNFAAAHYALAFVEAQAGDPRAAIVSADQSRRLSPFDPLLFGMFGSRAFALVRLGEFAEAGEWALKAAARPNAHAQIHAIAAFTLALADSLDEARRCAAAVQSAHPSYTVADFLRAFRLEPEAAALFRRGAERLGMD
jgi:TolB-like protein